MALTHMMELRMERQPPGILRMSTVYHIAQRGHPLVWPVLQHDGANDFPIYRGHLLALAQIGDRVCALRGAHSICDAAAGAAAVEPKHEPGPLRRAAMHEGIDAQRPVCPNQPGLKALYE